MNYGTDVLNKLKASHKFASVDLLGDSETAPTPSLATLRRYTAVFVYSDCDFYDAVAIGNVLANYVDAGGHVVIATFSLGDTSDCGIDGRLVTGGYLPVAIGNQTDGTQMQLAADQPSSPLLAGVTTFDGGTSSYHDTGTIANGGILVAHWSGDGLPLVAVKGSATAGHVVVLNFYPPSSDARNDFWLAPTDGVRLMTNALLFGTLTHT